MIVQLESNWKVVNIKGLHCGKSCFTVNSKAISYSSQMEGDLG